MTETYIVAGYYDQETSAKLYATYRRTGLFGFLFPCDHLTQDLHSIQRMRSCRM